MKVFEIIQQVAATSSTKEKQAILEANKENRTLLSTFLYAENPRYNFWIKGFDIAVGTVGGKELSLYAFTQLDRLINREITGNAARKFLADLLREHTPDSAIIINRIVNRDLRCKCGTAIVNKVWKNLIPEYPMMLCDKFNEKTEKYLRSKDSFVVQNKSDGGRINIKVGQDGNVSYHSRNGSTLELFGRFDEQFKNFPGLIFDGELLVKTEDGIVNRQKSNGYYTKAVRGTLTKEESELFVVVLWDVIPETALIGQIISNPYNERLSYLVKMVDSLPNNNSVEVTEYELVHSIEECLAFYDKMRLRGEEGAIIKVSDSLWEDRRSKNQIKLKAEDEGDFLCTGWTEGTGDFVGMMGSLQCQTACGKVKFSVGSGFKVADRTDGDQYIGKIIKCRYNEIISSRDRKDGTLSLFLPIFDSVRWDKTTANTMEELK